MKMQEQNLANQDKDEMWNKLSKTSQQRAMDRLCKHLEELSHVKTTHTVVEDLDGNMIWVRRT